MDTGTCWGAIRQAALSTQPCDRHSEQVTPGHPWHMSRRLGSETGLRPGILRWTPTLRAQMRQRHTARTQRPHGLTPNTRTRSRRHTLTHHDAKGHAAPPRTPGRSANPGVSTPTRFAPHSSTIMPLVVGCSIEARVSEPGPGTGTWTLLPARPRQKLYG